MSPILSKVEDAIHHLKTSGASPEEIKAVIGALVNSPILAAAVAATPTRIDDWILAGLKRLFPAS